VNCVIALAEAPQQNNGAVHVGSQVDCCEFRECRDGGIGCYRLLSVDFGQDASQLHSTSIGLERQEVLEVEVEHGSHCVQINFTYALSSGQTCLVV
jgi:hypothetical protein